jgi:hypothetical protein
MNNRATLLALTIAVVASLAGCVSVKATGAASVEDFQAEQAYGAVYAAQMTKVAADLVAFKPSGANLGVCDKGGTKQGCHDADVVLIADLQALVARLEATPVPPRFVEADGRLRAALAENIRALQLRNQAIETRDDAIWAQHQTLMAQAVTDLNSAYQLFPADNRPQPAP